MANYNKIAFGEHLRTPVGFASIGDIKATGQDSMQTETIFMGAGNATTRAATSTADKRFMNFYTESTATSGDSRGIYWQHFLSGAGATGDCARFFTKVNATGVAGGFGVHATLQVQDDATTGITGLANGVRATLAAEAASRTLGGTLAALQVDSDVATGNTLPATSYFIRAADNGAVKIANLLGFPAASSFWNAGESATTAAGTIQCYVEGTGIVYIPAFTSSS